MTERKLAQDPRRQRWGNKYPDFTFILLWEPDVSQKARALDDDTCKGWTQGTEWDNKRWKMDPKGQMENKL